MPLTTVDPRAALILIDLQQGIVGIPTVHPASEIIARSATLARAFRQRSLPVVLVNVTAASPGRTDAGPRVHTFPEGWDQLVPELDQQPTDLLISKQCVSALIGTPLHEALQQQGVTQIFLTGIATSGGIEATARNARDLGYHVVIITDAITDRDAATHQHCVDKVFPRLAETATTQTVLQFLAN